MQVSWIDSDEVRALADSLRPTVPTSRHVQEPELTAGQSLLDDDGESFADATAFEPSAKLTPDLSKFREQLQNLRAHAIDVGVLKPQSASATTEPAPTDEVTFEIPLGSIGDRLLAFAAWARQRVPTRNLLVFSDQGDLLWGPQASTRQYVEALVAIRHPASERTTSSGQKILTCPTRWGKLHLVSAGTGELAEPEVSLFQQALTAAINAG